MSNSFIFYRGFADTIKLAPREDRLNLFEYLCGCALGDIEIDDVPYPMNLTVKSMLASVEASRQRYEKAVERGKKGGRPSKQSFTPPEIWIPEVLEYGIPKAAEKLDIDASSLYRWVKGSDDSRLAEVQSRLKSNDRQEQKKQAYDPTVDWSKSED